jgi:hypothetical protein
MYSIINNSIKANNSFWFLTRIFGAAISIVSILMISVGLFIGIKYTDNPGLFGVSIVFLIQLTEDIQWIARQLINMESIMVSV